MKATKNDYKLIKYLFESKFLTKKQILDYILSDMNSDYVKSRITQLKKYRYLKYITNPLPFINEKNIYLADFFAYDNLLHKKMIKDFKEMCKENNLLFINPKEYNLVKELNYNNVIHDYYLNNLRLMLEEIGAKNWLPDFIIKKRKKHDKVPDGLIKGKYNIAIELERTLKKPKRYGKIFDLYQDENNIDFVIYVTVGKSSDNIYKRLKGFMKPSFLNSKYLKNEELELVDNFHENYFLIKYENFKNGNYIIKNTYNDKEYYLPDIL